MSANVCSICSHPQSRLIDAEVNTGRPAQRVAGAFAVSSQALRRHIRNGHVIPPASPPVVTAGEPSGTDEDLLRGLLVGLQADLPSLSPAAKTARVEAIRRMVESIHRVAPPGAADLTEVEEKLAALEAFQLDAAEVMESFTEAKSAIAMLRSARRGDTYTGAVPELVTAKGIFRWTVDGTGSSATGRWSPTT